MYHTNYTHIISRYTCSIFRWYHTIVSSKKTIESSVGGIETMLVDYCASLIR